MACLSAFCGGWETKGKMETIFAEGLLPVSAAAAEKVDLLAGEMMFGHNSLACASYPALLFRLQNADAAGLKRALAKALRAYPHYAGRLMSTSHDPSSLTGGKVALTNQGVPFTIIEDQAATAPDLKDEMAVLKFGDFRCPRRVAKSLDPIMTVTLTTYRDGTAVLAFSRTHALLDGTTAWSFLDAWARAARGEAIEAGSQDRDALRAALPSTDELQEIAVEVTGDKLTSSLLMKAMNKVVPCVITSMDALFLSGMYSLGRPRVFFSDAELARIKDAATPSPDGKWEHTWVSTQEALSAYLLLKIAKATLKPSSRGRGAVTYWLDPRKALGVKASHHMGCGFIIVLVPCGDVLTSSLSEVAGRIHKHFQEEMTVEQMGRRWKLLWGSCEHDLQFAGFQSTMSEQRRYDVNLQLNNQMKRKLPDFGSLGGQTTGALTNAGPSIALPTEGGIDVYLDWGMLKSKTATASRALELLREELP